MPPLPAGPPAIDPHADRASGALLGLAYGDALGTTVEFAPRGSFEPLTDLVGGGPFGLRPGEWTDDTSMALCLAESLLERRGFDPRDQSKRYVRWWGAPFSGRRDREMALEAIAAPRGDRGRVPI